MHVILSFLLCQGISFASAEEAELNRLRSEIQRYRKISDWQSMNRAYENLVELRSSKTPLNFSDYVLGAYVAQELGLLQECIVRLEAALKINPQSEDEKGWLNFIISSTESVNLRVSTKERTLLIEEMPFDPVFQKAIDVADVAFQTEARFSGRLPFGVYTYGTQTFTVVKGEKARLRKVEIPMEEVVEKKPEPKKKEQKPSVPREYLDYAPAALDLSVQHTTYRYIERAAKAYDFQSSGMNLGGIYRHKLEEMIGMDLALVLGLEAKYMSSEEIDLIGLGMRVFGAKRFGNFELGAGYYGQSVFIRWNCGADNYGNCSYEEGVESETTPWMNHSGSGLGMSFLYDLTPYLALEYVPSITWDGEFSPFLWNAAHIQFSFR
jgi:hypothetical protein